MFTSCEWLIRFLWPSLPIFSSSVIKKEKKRKEGEKKISEFVSEQLLSSAQKDETNIDNIW